RRPPLPPRAGPGTAHGDRPRGARRLALRRRASRHRPHDRAHALPGHARPRPGGAQPPRRRAGRRARRRHRLRGRHAALRGLQPRRRGGPRPARRAVLSQHRARRALRQGAARGARRAPRPRATGLVRLRRTDLAQAYLVRLIATPPAPREVLALSLAVEIVGADPDARLFQEIRERLGLGYDLGAGVEHGRDWAVAVLSASAARNDERRLRETIERTCREAAAGFSAEELRRARKKVRYRFARLADSRLERALPHASRAACDP